MFLYCILLPPIYFVRRFNCHKQVTFCMHLHAILRMNTHLRLDLLDACTKEQLGQLSSTWSFNIFQCSGSVHAWSTFSTGTGLHLRRRTRWSFFRTGKSIAELQSAASSWGILLVGPTTHTFVYNWIGIKEHCVVRVTSRNQLQLRSVTVALFSKETDESLKKDFQLGSQVGKQFQKSLAIVDSMCWKLDQWAFGHGGQLVRVWARERIRPGHGPGYWRWTLLAIACQCFTWASFKLGYAQKTSDPLCHHQNGRKPSKPLRKWRHLPLKNVYSNTLLASFNTDRKNPQNLSS